MANSLGQLILILLLANASFAQTKEKSEQKVAPVAGNAEVKDSESETEGLYDDFEKKEQVRKIEEQKKEAAKPRIPSVPKFSDLSRLSPFEDVAVISRKFIPKTGRFDLSTTLAFTVNNPFYTNLGGDFALGYSFSESWAIATDYFILSGNPRQITKDLDSKANVETKSLVSPKNFLGFYLRWMPIYGKMSFLDEAIVPYDIYFRLGGGLTQTEEKSGESTVSFGIGQVFGVNKSLALKWDFLWNYYQATVTEAGEEKKLGHSDLFLNVGLSFFFPEAKYR